MNFYKRFIGDYRKKTSRLTPLQHGVYTLFLDECYATEEPLPLDLEELHEVAHARTETDEAAVQKVLKRYFTRTKDGWVNKRAVEEISAFAEKSDKARSAAATRWESERTCERITERTCNARSRDSQSQSPDSIARNQLPEPESRKSEPAQRNGARLSDTWMLPDGMAEWTVREMGWPQERIAETEARFRDYWIARARGEGTQDRLGGHMAKLVPEGSGDHRQAPTRRISLRPNGTNETRGENHMSEWRDVEIGDPILGEYVLGYWPDFAGCGPRIAQVRYAPGPQLWVGFGKWTMKGPPTHWMPLPLPPGDAP